MRSVLLDPDSDLHLPASPNPRFCIRSLLSVLAVLTGTGWSYSPMQHPISSTTSLPFSVDPRLHNTVHPGLAWVKPGRQPFSLGKATSFGTHAPEGQAEPPSPRAWGGQRRREPGLISRPGRTGRAPGGCPEQRRHVRERPGGGGARRRPGKARLGPRRFHSEQSCRPSLLHATRRGN